MGESSVAVSRLCMVRFQTGASTARFSGLWSREYFQHGVPVSHAKCNSTHSSAARLTGHHNGSNLISEMTTLLRTLSIATLVAASSLMTFAEDAKLDGTWTTKKTGPDGNAYTQSIGIKKDKFTFRVIRDGDVVMFAEGSFKTEKVGSLKIAKFTDIKAGASESNTNPIDDDHTSVYTFSDEALVLAANFDKERDGQKPSADTYTRSKK